MMSLEVEIDEHLTRSQRYNEEATKLRRKWELVQNFEATKCGETKQEAKLKVNNGDQ